MVQSSANHELDMEASERISQIQSLERELSSIQIKGIDGSLRERLAKAHPLHPARLIKPPALFMVMIGVLFAIACIAIPFASDSLGENLVRVQQAVPLPLPALGMLLSLFMGFAWVTAHFSSLFAARECALLPREQTRVDAIKAQLSEMMGTNTPESSSDSSSHSPRIRTPIPLESQQTASSNAQESSFALLEPFDSIKDSSNSPAASQASPGWVQESSFGPPPGPFHQDSMQTKPIPTVRTPIHPVQEAVRPNNDGKITLEGKSARTGSRHRDITDERPHSTTTPNYLFEPSSAAQTKDETYTIGVGTPTNQSKKRVFSAPNRTRIPQWEDIDEAWLKTAIESAVSLAKSFPIQAYMEFSPELDLPFELVIERATPAVINHAILEFVKFLSCIAVPSTARISLKNIAHINPAMCRVVASALDTHCDAQCEVSQAGSEITIAFLEPDTRWKRYSRLPIASR